MTEGLTDKVITTWPLLTSSVQISLQEHEVSKQVKCVCVGWGGGGWYLYNKDFHKYVSYKYWSCLCEQEVEKA